MPYAQLDLWGRKLRKRPESPLQHQRWMSSRGRHPRNSCSSKRHNKPSIQLAWNGTRWKLISNTYQQTKMERDILRIRFVRTKSRNPYFRLLDAVGWESFVSAAFAEFFAFERDVLDSSISSHHFSGNVELLNLAARRKILSASWYRCCENSHRALS